MKNVGDLHKVPPEKCGRLAHNTPGKMWEMRGGAHSGARLDPTLMCSWPPLSSPLAPPWRTFPPSVLSKLMPHLNWTMFFGSHCSFLRLECFLKVRL